MNWEVDDVSKFVVFFFVFSRRDDVINFTSMHHISLLIRIEELIAPDIATLLLFFFFIFYLPKRS